MQTSLNEIVDEFWTVVDPQQYIEVQEIMDKIRKFFNVLCDRLDAAEQKINNLEKIINNASISEGHLLLGSVATRILVKMGRYLNHNELVSISACRSFNDFNTVHDVANLKSLLETNNFKWEEVRTIIKMLKKNRLTIAHPTDPNTTKEDILNAIKNRYPGRKLRAGSGRKAPEIAGTWKQYSHRKIFGFFPMISDRFLLEST
jgi:hypothetical protein